MSKTTTATIALSVLLAMPAASQTRTVYVPGVAVIKPGSPPPEAQPQFRELNLESFLSAFNRGSATASIQRLAAFDTRGPMVITVFGPVPMVPGQVFRPEANTVSPNGVPEIIKYELSGDVVLTATLERLYGWLPDCAFSGAPPPEGTTLPQGRIPLPVFEGLFPADTVAASGDVIPFNPGPIT